MEMHRPIADKSLERLLGRSVGEGRGADREPLPSGVRPPAVDTGPRAWQNTCLVAPVVE